MSPVAHHNDRIFFRIRFEAVQGVLYHIAFSHSGFLHIGSAHQLKTGKKAKMLKNLLCKHFRL